MDNRGRAETPEDKKQIINRILAVWISSPYQRLGQLVYNAMRVSGDGKDLFYIEDKELARTLEDFLQGIEK